MKSAFMGMLTVLIVGCSTSTPVAQASTTSSPSAPSVLLIASGAGSSDPYDSNDFSTAGDWQIAWSYDCSAVTNGHDWLILGVYAARTTGGGTLYDELTPLPGGELTGLRLEDSSSRRGPTKGLFFIRVVTECSWHLRVTPL